MMQKARHFCLSICDDVQCDDKSVMPLWLMERFHVWDR